ncbi:hypothetical protein QU487_15490 [Crenobacter sp. SG2305]|uniref:type IV pilus modification PilV family protein n=1 Tax=Crenobacter oryzisoli TaxID=3056844 RepID=UPI0025AA3FBF|nr:hypothetical protein [Crenobacter sp. SG2305]MDN0084143.1 hypothetical protein [Crenobacter sp. SG2305]
MAAAERGFSLVDYLIACALVTGGFYALATTQLRSHAQLRDAELQTQVALHAESLRESVLAGVAPEAAHALFRQQLQTALGEDTPLRTALCAEEDLAVPPDWQALGCDAGGVLTLKVVWRLAGRQAGALRYGSYQLRVAP